MLPCRRDCSEENLAEQSIEGGGRVLTAGEEASDEPQQRGAHAKAPAVVGPDQHALLDGVEGQIAHSQCCHDVEGCQHATQQQPAAISTHCSCRRSKGAVRRQVAGKSCQSPSPLLDSPDNCKEPIDRGHCS